MNCEKCHSKHDGKYGTGRFCSRKCANSRTFSDESKLKKSLAAKGKPSPFKGIVRVVKELKVVGICEYCNNPIEKYSKAPKKYHVECYRKCSGGYRRGSGFGKSGWYGDIWCDSSYELAWVIYQTDHNLSFERNRIEYEYVWNGVNKKYIPDFIQNENIIEIKGYFNEQTYAKIEAVPNLIILTKSDLKFIFDYVIKTYGKDFIKMYNNYTYRHLTGTCKECKNPCKRRNKFCSNTCYNINRTKKGKNI